MQARVSLGGSDTIARAVAVMWTIIIEIGDAAVSR